MGAGGYSDSPGLKANGYTFSAGPTQRQTNSPTFNLKRPISRTFACLWPVGGSQSGWSELLEIEPPI